jgi:frataxin
MMKKLGPTLLSKISYSSQTSSLKRLASFNISHGQQLVGTSQFNANNFESLLRHQNSQTSKRWTSSKQSFNYEKTANETLESLTERFDYLSEELGDLVPDDFDVSFSNGVLNVKLGGKRGTYVLNKQTPNLQIWLSSPVSGPKRFDFENGHWVYKRTGQSLHALLESELSDTFGKSFDFRNKCAFSKKPA